MGRTNCSDVLERLPLYVGADLDEDALAFVRAHLDECEACAKQAEAADRAREAFRTSLEAQVGASRIDAPGSRSTASADLWDGVRATLVREGRIHSGSADEFVPQRRVARPALRLVSRWAPAAAAAAVVAVVAIGSGLFDAGRSAAPAGAVGTTPVADDGASGALLVGIDAPASMAPGERRLQRIEPGAALLQDEAQPLRRSVEVPGLHGERGGRNQLASSRTRGPRLR